MEFGVDGFYKGINYQWTDNKAPHKTLLAFTHFKDGFTNVGLIYFSLKQISQKADTIYRFLNLGLGGKWLLI